MPTTGSKENEFKKEINENLIKKALTPYFSSYNLWIFENYTKNRLKSLDIICRKRSIHFVKNIRFFQINYSYCAI